MSPGVSGKPAEVVRALYDDWSEGNFASSVDLFHPDVLFKSPVDDHAVRGREAMATSIRDIL